MTFHDGSVLTAEVVAWNVTRMVQHPKSLARGYLPQVDWDAGPGTRSADRPDQPDPPERGVLSALSDTVPTTAIVSKKAVDERGEEG